ncbi:MAG: hypothetical protein QXL86_03680 [Candidatus Aenigmatarchaeota archaeon]
MKKKKINLALIILLLLGVLILLANLPYQPKGFVENMTFEKHSDLFFNYEIIRYPSSVEVSPVRPDQERLKLGVVVDPWNLNFGIVPIGNNFVTRFIEISNPKEKSAKIVFKVYGNISPFVNFTRNDFIIRPNESVTIEAKFYAEKAKIGNYTGEIDIVIQRPKYEFLYNFWK